MINHAGQYRDVSFAAELEQEGKPVMIGFVAEWCGACHILEPILHRLSLRYAESIQTWVLDSEKYPLTKAKFNIYKLPTVLLFNNGELVDQFTGLVLESELSEKLNHMVAGKQSQQ